jgi:hypothetical protein
VVRGIVHGFSRATLRSWLVTGAALAATSRCSRPGSFRAKVYAGIDPLSGKRRYLVETAVSESAAKIALTKPQPQVDEDPAPEDGHHRSAGHQAVARQAGDGRAE